MEVARYDPRCERPADGLAGRVLHPAFLGPDAHRADHVPAFLTPGILGALVCGVSLGAGHDRRCRDRLWLNDQQAGRRVGLQR